jgi:hypothetical protein
MLARGEPERRRKFSPFAERRPIAQGTSKSTGGERANTTQLQQSLRHRIRLHALRNPFIKACYAIIKASQVFSQASE